MSEQINLEAKITDTFDTNKVEIVSGKYQLKVGGAQTPLTYEDTMDSGTGKTFSASDIEFSAGKCQLKLVDNTGQTDNQPFTADTGFTYDAAKTEFAAGKCQQKIYVQPNSTIYCDYETPGDANAVHSSGVGTGTLNGGATVAGGFLNLKGGTLKYASYAAASNFQGSNVGTLRIINYKPNYSGTPTTNQNLIHINNGVNTNWLCALTHTTGTGNLVFALRDGAGANIYSSTFFGVWAPTAGDSYDLEINWDLISGATRLFLNGVQFGSTKTDTGTYTPSGLTNIYIGTNVGLTNNPDYEIGGYIIYTTVQHTTDFTPQTLTRYVEDLVTLPQFQYSGLGARQAFTAFATTQTGGQQFNVAGKYWDGGAWVASNDTLAQMNSVATINTNIGSLTAIDNYTVKTRWTASNNQQSIDDLTVTYTGQIYPVTNPPVEYDANVITIVSPETMVLTTFTETSTKPGTDEIKWILSTDGGTTWQYYNSGWVVSNETYAQSSTASDVNTNIGTLVTTSGTLILKWFMHSNDGSTTPELDKIVVGYTKSSYATDNPSITYIEAFSTTNLLGFFETATKPSGTEIKYIPIIGGEDKYWNGSQVVSSNGTYSQANLAEDIDTYRRYFITEGITFGLKAFLHSDDGTVTPIL